MNDKNFDRISYALGLSMGNNFRASGIESIDVADFAEGVQAVFSGSTDLRMSYDEAKEEIRRYFTAMQERQQAEAAKAGEQNRRLGSAYLADNGKRPEVVTTASGLQYEIICKGEGATPKDTDRVKVHYTGRLIDGTVFDDSVERGEPATFGVTQVIPGWVEALQLMPVGSKWRLHIPSELAYGPNGAGGVIGPDAVLVFDVELLEIL
ncbi:MAG: FKBP-type peptidyl-prolyl cis-trans isomerase [Muribaculaceae bacterium]|nr:FKBP-type peptidyl-prolyl cis-trans isomerase [Muribaculaceae bacterium]